MDLPLVNASAFYEIWPLAVVSGDGDGGCAAVECSNRDLFPSTTQSTVTYQSGGNGWDQRREEEEEGTAMEAKQKEYIHVRARRGEATDSHSLAERVRREKISERMRILQGLVPGCSKVTGKALILDEIINYIQSLEHQIQLLTMKLEMFYGNNKGVGRWSKW